MIKTCATCGKSFETRFGTDYCSAKCKRIAEAEPQPEQRPPHIYICTCIICGKQFETYFPRKNTCSRECAVLKNRQRARKQWEKKQFEKIQKNLRTATCPICGKVFETHLPNKITCSLRCTKQFYYQNQLKMRLQNRHPVTKSCVICGKKFETSYPKKITCSDSCKDICRYLKRVSYNKFWKEFNHDC